MCLHACIEEKCDSVTHVIAGSCVEYAHVIMWQIPGMHIHTHYKQTTEQAYSHNDINTQAAAGRDRIVRVWARRLEFGTATSSKMHAFPI